MRSNQIAAKSNVLIYQNENGNINVDVVFEDKDLWLSQAQLCDVFGKAKATISEHISHIIDEGELDTSATVRKYRTVQTEGSREVTRELDHYNLEQLYRIFPITNALRSQLNWTQYKQPSRCEATANVC